MVLHPVNLCLSEKIVSYELYSFWKLYILLCQSKHICKYLHLSLDMLSFIILDKNCYDFLCLLHIRSFIYLTQIILKSYLLHRRIQTKSLCPSYRLKGIEARVNLTHFFLTLGPPSFPFTISHLHGRDRKSYSIELDEQLFLQENQFST